MHSDDLRFNISCVKSASATLQRAVQARDSAPTHQKHGAWQCMQASPSACYGYEQMVMGIHLGCSDLACKLVCLLPGVSTLTSVPLVTTK